MTAPDLLLLDEPAAGLDLGAREDLVERLAGLAAEPSPIGIVLVTHHLEEIPPGFGHAMVLADGRCVAAGPVATALTAATLSAAYGAGAAPRDGRRPLSRAPRRLRLRVRGAPRSALREAQ